MKSIRRFPFKLLICYAITMIVLFFGWSVAGTRFFEERLIDLDKDSLYHELRLISDNYVKGYFSKSLVDDKLSKTFSLLHAHYNARVFVIRKDRLIISDTDATVNTLLNKFLPDESELLSQTYTENATIPGLIDEPFFAVSYPIYDDMSHRGHLLIIKYYSDYYSEADKINSTYLPFICIIALLITVIYYVIYRIVGIPLKKSVKAAKEFSNHNYDYTYNPGSLEELILIKNALTYMGDELKNLENYQKAFISNISHDLRSPLTSIRGYAEAMIDGTIPPELFDKYLNIILFESKRLNKLAESLLTLGNTDRRNSKLDITDFDINTEIKKTASSFEGTCVKKQIQIKLEFDAPETIVSADIVKIQQVLYNLIDNAIKFSHTSSSIKISTRVVNNKVFVSVKDYGIGIPKEATSKIWDRFYKTDLSRGKDKKGTGLGLSIVKEIITSHNENIDVISTVDVGTEFTFSLPGKSV